MAMGPTHRVGKVPLRDVWEREQQDFSRWLVDNIDFLNEHLPFDVDPESLRVEQAAGDFWVDVVGDATNPDSSEPMKVVIENQLEQTDHDHLGKVLTYVSAFDASAAIWISARARPEHAKAVQWLNDESSIDAWLFNVEVIRIAESPEAPLLTQIVGPSALSKLAKADKQADQADKAKKLAFWEAVLPPVEEACSALGVFQGRAPSTSVHVSQKVSGGPGTTRWQLWVTANGSWICLKLDGDTKEEVDFYYRHLLSQRSEIDGAFGDGLKWDPLGSSRAAVVRWDNPVGGGFRDGSEDWADAGRSMATAMARLIMAAGPLVVDLPRYEPVDGEAEAISLVGDDDLDTA